MGKQTIMTGLELERAIDVNAKNLPNSQNDVMKQIKGFDIDKVYFSQDEDRSYPAIFIKKVELFDESTLKRIAKVHTRAWNYKKVSFLYVHTDTEIRIYNCIETPVFVTDKTDYEKEMKEKELVSCKLSDKEQLEKLNQIFSSMAIDSGLIWSVGEAADIRKKIDLQRRVDQYLVKSLTNVTEVLKNDGLKIELIHRLILRSLFLLYLEDRKATNEELYATIKKDAKSYFCILKDVKSTYKLFKKLERHFNGNVFFVENDEEKKVKNKHLDIIRKCFVSGYDKDNVQMELFPNWRLFDFSIIQIELLSQIYENFLAKVDKNTFGTYYTPLSLVELILNEKLPMDVKEKQYRLKILDPACGSGIFLIESFRRLVKRYENHHKKELTDFNTLKKLLVDNIYGIELDGNAIKVAAFSLYLALLNHLEPKTLWQGKKLPYLINDPKDKTLREQGKNLYRRDAIEENKDIEKTTFDLIVGNPPFGTETKERKLLASIRSYCTEHGFHKEMAIPFLHKAVSFAPDGEIALIFNTKILTNTGTTYQKFRKWLMQECYVEKVYNFSIFRAPPKNFGGRLFDVAIGPVSVVFYRKKIPQNSNNNIVYYAPKTYVKSNILEGVVIDSTDVKYLPREECQKPDTKIWKIAMWGGVADFELIRKISSKYKALKDVFKDKNSQWKYVMGLNADSENLDFVPKIIIDTKKISRYYTPHSACYTNNEKYYRKINERCFVPPFIVIKQAQAKRQIAASYIDYKAYCLSSAYAINGNEISDTEKKVLTAIFNSTFSKYFLFMLASSWGIERERVHGKELLLLPYLFDDIDNNIAQKISDLVDQIINIKKSNLIFNEMDIVKIENDIDTLLFKNVLKLSTSEEIIIRDALKYSLDLFEKQQKSEALLPVLPNHTIEYGEIICKVLNGFLEGADLFVNATVYEINSPTPLIMIKLTHEKMKKSSITKSNEKIKNELEKLDKYLWEKKSNNIYFRKKINYYDGDDIFVIRPNQRRFWSKSMATEDASEIILENLLGTENDEK